MGILQITKQNTCCFSGYRSQKLPWGTNEADPRCAALRIRLYETADMLYAEGIRNYICGMALGSDFLFCEEVLKLREDRGDVTIEAALPCKGQAERWREEERERYFRLVEACDYCTLVSREYSRECMLLRNRYMVDKAGVLVAVYDGRFGGTMQTVNYAEKQGLRIIRIKP